MCGILGIASNRPVVSRLLMGLSRLEYRGYDSSGIAVLDGEIKYQKSQGKIKSLHNLLEVNPLEGEIGIGHTRWATHGNPSVINAHPHVTGEVAVVHNGIIENADELRGILKDEYNITCDTNTDTEVIPKLITVYLHQKMTPLVSVNKVIKLLEGSFTFAALFKNDNSIIAVKKGSPLLLGYGMDNEIIISSDLHALSLFAERVVYLDNYDCAYIKDKKCTLYNINLQEINHASVALSKQQIYFNKGNYPNFMLKEIFEQPTVIADTVKSYCYGNNINISEVKKMRRGITIIACGSSYFAALIAKYWLSSIGMIVVRLEIASEFIYQGQEERSDPVLFISQSGETADILMALEHARSRGFYIVSLTNTKNSSLARLSDRVLYTEAGNEIGVASTKTFLSQLIVLQCLSLAIGRMNGKDICVNSYIKNIASASDYITKFLDDHNELYQAVDILLQAKSIIYIGRGTSYGIAMEGALKLKELSYISVEGIAAGELKHGPIALIDENVVTVAIIPYDHLFFKTFSNIQEIIARGGIVIAISDKKGEKLLSKICDLVITMPIIDDFCSPILYTVPVQLLAYYTALRKGNNIDQPRNLAKSVTVE